MALPDKVIALRILSKKGGVGKTTIAINLALALAESGKRVLLIDGDFANANISDHLGTKGNGPSLEIAFLEMLPFKESIFTYKPGGIDVFPGDDNYTPGGKIDMEEMLHAKKEIAQLEYDYMVVDTAPSTTPPPFELNLPKFKIENLIVSTPDPPTIKSNSRLVTLFNENEIKLSLLLNKVGSNKYEEKVENINKKYGIDVLEALPMDNIVPRSITEHRPAYLMDKNSKFCLKIKNLANHFAKES